MIFSNFVLLPRHKSPRKKNPKRKMRMGKHDEIFKFCVVATPQIDKKKKNNFTHFPFIVAVRETRLRAAALLKIVQNFALVRKSNEKGDFEKCCLVGKGKLTPSPQRGTKRSTPRPKLRLRST